MLDIKSTMACHYVQYLNKFRFMKLNYKRPLIVTEHLLHATAKSLML